ncbi:MAG: hypothetical protein GY696_22670 [Gammaproteobacteria bacterium]|nr:hypothetical protein [Gammaproteobacteria bacterium]
MTELWLLFGTSFLAATLLPGGSEALLAYAVHEQNASTESLLLIATLGNTLGGLTTWVPLVGDPLCFAAGWSGIRAVPAIIFMTLGKGARYAAIIYLIPVGS